VDDAFCICGVISNVVIIILCRLSTGPEGRGMCK
jgi:hypothetical protein